MGQNMSENDNVIRPAQWRTSDPAPVVAGSAALAWGPVPDPAEVRTPDLGPSNPDPAEVRTPDLGPSNPDLAEVRTPDLGEVAGPSTRFRLPEVDLARLVEVGAPKVLRATGLGLWWLGTGALFVAPDAVLRWVRQPDRAAEIADQRAAAQGLARQVREAVRTLDLNDSGAAATVGALQRQHGNLTDAVHQHRVELRRDRAIRTGVLVGIGGPAVVWGPPALFEWMPWWGDLGVLSVTAAGLAWIGRAWLRACGADDDELLTGVAGEAPVVPVGLLLSASNRGAMAELQERLVEVKARAVVEQVRRGEWGFRFEIRTAHRLTLRQLDDLAHALNTLRGGLIVSPVAGEMQRYVVRTIHEDLIADPVDAVEAPPGWTLTQRAPLVRSYDGSTVRVPLIDSMLLIGTTGSGKSTAQRECLRWLAGRAHLVGIDLMGGADLETFAPAMHEGVFAADLVRAERVLRFLVALIEDRTARFTASGENEWNEDMGRPWVLAVDEYWSLAQHKTLRDLVDSIIVSGRKVWVRVNLANNKRQSDLMKSRVVTSQIDTVWLFAMSADDEAALPAEWRHGGARPSTLRPAKVNDPRDAGKCYGIVGAETRLVRWPGTDKGASRAAAVRAGAPELNPADAAVWQRFTDGGDVPRLVALVREAIVVNSSHRDVPRASVAEIAAHCTANGVPLAATAVTAELTRVMGKTLRPPTRDMNLEPGKNPKGFRLDEFDRYLGEWLAARRDG